MCDCISRVHKGGKGGRREGGGKEGGKGEGRSEGGGREGGRKKEGGKGEGGRERDESTNDNMPVMSLMIGWLCLSVSTHSTC